MTIARFAEEFRIDAPGGFSLWACRIPGREGTVILPNALYLLDDLADVAGDRTLIAYDLRNRGRSGRLDDPAVLHRGIYNDVDDLELVRRFFKVQEAAIIGHSYLGLMVILYAIEHSHRVERLVQLGAVGMDPDEEYAAGDADDVAELVKTPEAKRLQERRERGDREEDPESFCHTWWEFMARYLVADPRHAEKLPVDRYCEHPNEWPVHCEPYLQESVMPSIARLRLRRDELPLVDAPVLTVHGTRDRNAPYGAGRAWARRLPDARLLTVPGAGHLPWLEAPERVLPAIRRFLAGHWPTEAERLGGDELRIVPPPEGDDQEG